MVTVKYFLRCIRPHFITLFKEFIPSIDIEAPADLIKTRSP